MKTFAQTLSAIVIGGLILGGIAIAVVPVVQREYAIREYAERYSISVDTARSMTDNGKNLGEHKLIRLLRQAREGN